MGASTGNMLVDDPAVLDVLFRDVPTLLAAHCEDTPTIQENEAAFRTKYGDAVPIRFHPEIRSAEACWKSSSLAVELARRHDTRLHVLHLTTERELELFRPGPPDGKRITAEVCIHHLWFDDRDYEERGTLIKCNPAIKTRADRDALRAGLREGRLDLVGTDHAPHTLEEKGRGYFGAPAGLPLVQHALPMLLELVHDGHLGLELAVEKFAHAPARLFASSIAATCGRARTPTWCSSTSTAPTRSGARTCSTSAAGRRSKASGCARAWSRPSSTASRSTRKGASVGEPAGQRLQFAR